MNRYVIEGIVRDVQAGKRVALAASTRRLSVAVWRNVAASCEEWERVSRVHGRERIDHPSGGVVVPVSVSDTGGRGMTLDVAVLLDGLRPIEHTARRERFLEDLMIAGATVPGGIEIIRCE